MPAENRPAPERPIIFSAPMVRAILAGRKTQTRRLLRPQPIREGAAWHWKDCAWTDARPRCPIGDGFAVPLDHCPYGEVGDRLWVREAWAPADSLIKSYDCDPTEAIWYAADDVVLGPVGKLDATGWTRPPKHPSIHMPRWASRITLRVTGVRVERMQAITEDDARAEGVAAVSTEHRGYPGTGAAMMQHAPSFRRGVEEVWDSINGKRAPWESNPWVWVLACEVVKS